MGTRGAYGYQMGGKKKVTYNHFDSYPSGLGADVLDYCKKHNPEEMREVFDKIVLIQGNDSPTIEQIKETTPFHNMEVSGKTVTDWYCLLREAQGDLEAFHNGLRYMINSEDFLEDSLFCEWAYIINLDLEILEVFQGFQKKDDDEYGPVARIAMYPLSRLPETMDELEKYDE